MVLCGVVWCCVVLLLWCGVVCGVRCVGVASKIRAVPPTPPPPDPPPSDPLLPDPLRPTRFGASGASHDSPRTPNVHISGSRRFKNTTKIPRRDPQERGEKARHFGLPTFRGSTLRGPTFCISRKRPKSGLGQKWSGPKVVRPGAGQKWSPFWAIWGFQKRAKSGLGQKWSGPKVVCAKVVSARPEPREPEDFEPGTTRDGWQHEAASHVEEAFRAESLCPRMCDSRKALMRSQGGPGDGPALSTCPVNRLTTFTSQLFRVVLLRRLHLPLPLTVRNCWCGFPLDSRGRAACARARGLGGRFWAVQNAAAWICREAGGRVTTNVLVRDLDLAAPHVDDARRLEVVVDGLPLFGRAQLAVDTTLVRAGGVLLNMTGWPPKLHVSGRREPILNLWGPTAEPTWWSWPSMGFHFGMCCSSGRGVHHVGAVGSSRL